MKRIKNILLAILWSWAFTWAMYFVLWFFYDKYSEIRPYSTGYPLLYSFYLISGLFLIFSLYSAWTGSHIIKKYFWSVVALLIWTIFFWFLFLPKPIPACPETRYLKNIIFIYQSRGETYRKLPDAYAWNFTCMDDHDMYDGKSNKFIYMSWSPSPILEYADPMTFVALSDAYAKDKKNVYFWGDIVRGVDSASFEVMGEEPFRFFGKDKNRVYQWRYVLEWIHPSEFSIIWCNNRSSCYFRDKENVYWTYWKPELIPVIWADVATFKSLGRLPFAVDKKHTYRMDTVIEGLNPRWLKYVGDSFYKNRLQLYHERAGFITWADLETFTCEEYSGNPQRCWDSEYYYDYTYPKRVGALDREIVKTPKIEE